MVPGSHPQANARRNSETILSDCRHQLDACLEKLVSRGLMVQ